MKQNTEPVYLSLEELRALHRFLDGQDPGPDDNDHLDKIDRKVVNARNTVCNRLGVPR